MGFLSGLFGSKPKLKRAKTMTGPQMAYGNDMLAQSLAGLKDPYAGFAPLEQQAMSQYQQSMPGLLQRFSNMGDSALSSSGLNAALAGGQQSLAENLAAMKANYGLQSRGQFMQMGQTGMMPQFENYQTGGSQGLLGSLAPMALGLATGGMAGAGVFGRGMMNQNRGGYGMGGMLPLSMMLGGRQ